MIKSVINVTVTSCHVLRLNLDCNFALRKNLLLNIHATVFGMLAQRHPAGVNEVKLYIH